MRHKVLILLLILPFQLLAQNLISNSDFETRNGCPDSPGQYTLAEGWYSPGSGTPDYFNDCSYTVEYGTEFNCKGGQIPHSGHGYMGITSQELHRNPYYEYLETRLKQPLEEGKNYCIRMYISHGNSSCVLKELGVVFSQTPLKGLTTAKIHLPYTKISNESMQFESKKWMCIKGLYTAHGGENYITFGDFSEDSNFILLRNDPKLDQTFKSAYYFIDDVTVELAVDQECNCTAGN